MNSTVFLLQLTIYGFNEALDSVGISGDGTGYASRLGVHKAHRSQVTVSGFQVAYDIRPQLPRRNPLAVGLHIALLWTLNLTAGFCEHTRLLLLLGEETNLLRPVL